MMLRRSLLITADDFGIGLETSRGILELAELGSITSTVLLVNSPYAPASVHLWRAYGEPIELGWHPCLTLDRPVLPPSEVPSLVDRTGHFHKLGSFLKRLAMGKIREMEIETELSAQYERFLDLVRCLPINVNAHHHVHLFGPVSRSLMRILEDQIPKPYVRRVTERMGTLASVSGGRLKRFLLSRWGKRIPLNANNDELIGITNPRCVSDPLFFRRWVSRSSGSLVELTCHPGYLDESLVGRDGSMSDGQIHRREREFALLKSPEWLPAVAEAGFQTVTAESLLQAPSHSEWSLSLA